MAVEDPALVAQLSLVTHISSSIGILGSLLTLLLPHLSPRFNIPMTRLLTYLASTYLVSGIAMLLGPTVAREPFSAACKITGLMLQWGDFVSVILMFYIGFGLVLVTFLGWKPGRVRALDRYFFYAGCILAFAVSTPWLWVFPGDGLRPVYFSTTAWCWVSKTYPVIQASILYVPMLFVLAFDTIAFVAVGIRIWFRSRHAYPHNDTVRDAIHTYILSSLAYLILFSLCWIPATISLWIHFVRGESSYGQIMLRVVWFPLRGMVNFVLYVVLVGMAGQLKKGWKQPAATDKV